MTSKVFERRYYGTQMNNNGHDMATLWLERSRDNGNTVWSGGVTFAERTDYGYRTTVFDNVSWRTHLDTAPRACKRRDFAACKMLYTLAATDPDTRNALNGMCVYANVCADLESEVWTR